MTPYRRAFFRVIATGIRFDLLIKKKSIYLSIRFMKQSFHETITESWVIRGELKIRF
jgi:hypothetical protein